MTALYPRRDYIVLPTFARPEGAPFGPTGPSKNSVQPQESPTPTGSYLQRKQQLR